MKENIDAPITSPMVPPILAVNRGNYRSILCDKASSCLTEYVQVGILCEHVYLVREGLEKELKPEQVAEDIFRRHYVARK